MTTQLERIVLESEYSKMFPTADWLESIGFTVNKFTLGEYATTLIDDFEGTSAKAHVDLRLTRHACAQDEWLVDVISYNERGQQESAVCLVNSVCTTRYHVCRLCRVLGIKAWKEFNK